MSLFKTIAEFIIVIPILVVSFPLIVIVWAMNEVYGTRKD